MSLLSSFSTVDYFSEMFVPKIRRHFVLPDPKVQLFSFVLPDPKVKTFLRVKCTIQDCKRQNSWTNFFKQRLFSTQSKI